MEINKSIEHLHCTTLTCVLDELKKLEQINLDYISYRKWAESTRALMEAQIKEAAFWADRSEKLEEALTTMKERFAIAKAERDAIKA